MKTLWGMFTIFFLMAVVAFPAFAGAGVSVRTGGHTEYSRLVFDWPEKTTYEIEQEDAGPLLLRFSKNDDVLVKGLDLSDLVNISAVEKLSQSGKTVVRVHIPEKSKFRHFTIGNRVILDVYNPPGRKAETAKVSPEKTKAVSPEIKPTKPHPKATKEALAEDLKKALPESILLDPLSDDHAAPKTALDKVREKVDSLQPYAISLSTTEEVGMASFARNGNLWLVFDRADMKFAPQITGPDPAAFSKFETVKLDGGIAFYSPIPEALKDYHLYGEDGGLVWRLVITQQERETVPAVVENRVSDEHAPIFGGVSFWPLQGITEILELRDPAVGDVLKIVTVSISSQFTGVPWHFNAYDVLSSVVGMALKSHVDDLKIEQKKPAGLEITRPGGVVFSRARDTDRHKMRADITESNIIAAQKPGVEITRIFDFNRWMMGGVHTLRKNQNLLLSGSAEKDKNGRVQDLLTLAKMNIANDRGPEALGFLNFAAMEMPDIKKAPEYIALRGASYALSGKYGPAFHDFNNPVLKDYGELDYWRAFSLAWLEDWNQAQNVMPDDFSLVVGYPKELQEKIGLKLAEIALRNADVKAAKELLSLLERERAHLRISTLAGLDYLKGETHRQNGEFDEAKTLWKPLAHRRSVDDLYRVKAGVALTLLELQVEDIDITRAINRLEALRYAWRGDELETKNTFTLGQLYLRNNQYLKGFGGLRDSAGMSPGSDLGREVTAYMKAYFRDLLLESEDISPLDAAAVYEEFTELTPPGDEGNKLIQKLAERMLEADLLGRSTALLQHQVDYRLKGAEKARVNFRLATISLLDNKPKKAIKALDSAKLYYKKNAGKTPANRLYDISLLRAQALLQLDRAEEAILLLNAFDPDPKVNRLRADIAWRAGLWEDAAEGLQDLILDEALDLNRPLTEEQAALILNRAVALNLSSNRVALANIRKRYEGAMKPMAQGKQFDVISRSRNTALFADKETINALVSEVDIFKGFLESYRKSEGAVE